MGVARSRYDLDVQDDSLGGSRYLIITNHVIIYSQKRNIFGTRHVHKVSFPLVPQLANLILREATVIRDRAMM
jgi:hypothetical protein